MLIGFNGATTIKNDLLTDINIVQKLSYDALEIWSAKLYQYLKKNTVSDLKKILKRKKVRVWSINSIECITFQDDKTFAKKKRECKKLCEICADIGCKNIVVVPSPNPKNIKQSEIIKKSVDALCELSDIASKYNVNLAFEFLGFKDCSVNNLSLCNKIVKKVNSENVGVVIDTFHFYTGGSKLDSIKDVDANKIFIFHINDAENIPIKFLKDSHRLFPGDGIIPLREILFALKNISYDKIASIELFRPEYWEWQPEAVARIAKEKTLKILEG